MKKYTHIIKDHHIDKHRNVFSLHSKETTQGFEISIYSNRVSLNKNLSGCLNMSRRNILDMHIVKEMKSQNNDLENKRNTISATVKILKIIK